MKLSTNICFEERSRDVWILFGTVVVLFIVSSLLKPTSFLTRANIVSLLNQFPEYGLMAIGMMLCMMSGGVDLSQVGIANLSATVAALLFGAIQTVGTVHVILVIMLCLLAGAVCGLVNGIIIFHLRISPILTTLCTLQVFTGMVVIVTKGNALTGIPRVFISAFNDPIGNTVSTAVVIYVIVVLITAFVLDWTTFGKQLIVVGSNHVAANYSGIDNARVILATYMGAGIIAGLSGLLMCAHYASVKANYGSSYTLLSLLIVVLGGVDPKGGHGKISGVILSTIALQLMSSLFNIMRFNSHLKTFSWGLLLVCVMIIKYCPFSLVKLFCKGKEPGL